MVTAPAERARLGKAAERASTRPRATTVVVLEEVERELVDARAAGVTLEDLATILRFWTGLPFTRERVRRWLARA